ncbi:MAG TPA: sulfite exporter TauE/SafE family protein [Chitinophagales bacterium]|nr:sulfite exporter TauE/SafE family protein [Chitinophagales bacterium]
MIAAFIILAIIAEIAGTVGGFGSSLFFVPLAQFFFDMKTVLGITAIFHIFSNLAKLVLFRKTISWKLVLRFGVPGIVAVVLGAWLTTVVSFRYDELILGIFLIIFSVLLLLFPSLKIKDGWLSATTGGGIAGFLAGFLGTGGAIRGLFLAGYDLEKNLFIGTSAAIDMGVDLSRGVIYINSGYLTKDNYYLVPLLIGVSAIGTYIGKLLLGRMEQGLFKKTLLAMILGIGLVMLVRSIFLIVKH